MSKFCTKCGKEMDETARACPNCGAPCNGNAPLKKRDIAITVVLSIITCGIYGYYWNYKMGKKLHEAGKNANIDIADNSVLYIVLSVLGLAIVNYCLMQADLNKLAQE